MGHTRPQNRQPYLLHTQRMQAGLKSFMPKMCVTVSGLMELQWLDVDYTTLLHAIQLCKAFKARLWPDSKHVARQLEGIGKFVFIPPNTHTHTHTHTCLL